MSVELPLSAMEESSHLEALEEVSPSMAREGVWALGDTPPGFSALCTGSRPPAASRSSTSCSCR